MESDGGDPSREAGMGRWEGRAKGRTNGGKEEKLRIKKGRRRRRRNEEEGVKEGL